MYKMQNSKLDLFSEDAQNEQRLAWGDGTLTSSSPSSTPSTTARFIPGYDWDKSDGALFDDAANKAQESFEDTYGNW